MDPAGSQCKDFMSFIIPASVFILTKNSGHTLRKTLESVKNFEDILVCDGGSQDATLAIAKEYGAKIFKQSAACLDGSGKIADFSCARNECLSRASRDWVLYLDSDEYLSEKAAEEMFGIANNPNPSFFIWKVPRKHVLDGEIIECSLGYPNSQTRFFHKAHISGFIKPVHERIAPLPEECQGMLKYCMYVTVPPREVVRGKTDAYLRLEDERRCYAKKGELVRDIIHTLRAIVGSVLRLKNRFFCRGLKAPWKYEWLRFEYNFKLLRILVARLLWN